MTLPFTLKQLRVLKAIANERNFTKAAKALYISQPSLSKQIKLLEESLDIILINRKKNNVSLTENGKIFLQYAERILALCEESYRTLVDLKNGERGTLTIGASQTIGTYLMPRIVGLFAQTHPQITLQVQVNSTRMIAQAVLNRTIDIAVVGGEVPIELKKKLITEDFVQDQFALIISKSHPFAKKKCIKKNDLYHLKFIALDSNSTIRKFIDKTLLQNNINPRQLEIIIQLNSIEAIKTAVSLGLGAAFVSSSAIEKEIKLETIEIINIENITINRKLSIISNTDSYKSKAFELFYHELKHLKIKNIVLK